MVVVECDTGGMPVQGLAGAFQAVVAYIAEGLRAAGKGQELAYNIYN